ncbi:MAG: DNA-directed RNA polymerase subunit omega [Lachnospiraceae bacterium]|nr:DNA-directed RNA polymerase subunit omega [Lachnospiraceae bacterium]
MIHPSYSELFEVINGNDEDGEKTISSRYSICVANAKRARQLIKGATPLVEVKCNKPLSIAVEEIYQGKVKVLSAGAPTVASEPDYDGDAAEKIPNEKKDAESSSGEGTEA